MFTGSGMPMRFADLDGSMIDVYQAATQMTDESGQTYPFNADELLDNALGAEGYYGVFTANMHTDNASHAGSDAIVDSAQSRGVPVVSARQMLQWIDGRNGSSFDSLSWDGNQLDFTIEVGAGANGLRAMVPTDSEAGPLASVERNGIPVATTTETIKGVEYAFFDAAPGNYEAIFAADGDPPAITNVDAAPGRTGPARRSPGTPTSRPTRGSTTATDPDALTQSQSERVAGQLAQRAADRARPERRPTTTASPPRTRTTTRPRSRLRPRSRSASRRPRRASSTPRSPTSAPARPAPTPTSPRPPTAR